ncbi:MAG: tryptophan synthase subunit alpha [Deltaproteobacteria bacterium]|nr:tryptophan synthase subunit alpha [Deltaproteobacteria bacterium]
MSKRRSPGRIEACFARAREERRPVLVAYLCVGDPSVEASYSIARALLDAGADMLELGAPFSDPTADGPVIARASQRAIERGSSMRAAIALGARLRAETEAPLVLFGYANPIIVRGERDTVRAVHDAGIDAMLVVDLPPEEGDDLRDEARARGVDVIPLLTPTSSPSRVEAARHGASGFVYYVSVTGVTGSTASDPFDDAARAAVRLRGAMDLPVVVGFGIDSADKARRASGGGDPSRGADGVVVGTAIVRAIEEARNDVAAACANAAAITRSIRAV